MLRSPQSPSRLAERPSKRQATHFQTIQSKRHVFSRPPPVFLHGVSLLPPLRRPGPGVSMTATAMAPPMSRNLYTTIPGLLISAFFLWYTFRGISFNQIVALRIVHPGWILGVLGFTLAGYTLRCLRWTQMMPRATRSPQDH